MAGICGSSCAGIGRSRKERALDTAVIDGTSTRSNTTCGSIGVYKCSIVIGLHDCIDNQIFRSKRPAATMGSTRSTATFVVVLGADLGQLLVEPLDELGGNRDGDRLQSNLIGNLEEGIVLFDLLDGYGRLAEDGV